MPESAPFFEIPPFTFSNVLYTAIGAAIFWTKWGRTKLRAFALSDIIELFYEKDSKRAVALEFIIFIALGCIVGIGLTEPGNARQAFAAGMGWTGLFAGTKKKS